MSGSKACHLRGSVLCNKRDVKDDPELVVVRRR